MAEPIRFEDCLPATPADRSPPFSQEAEEHVIACCLIDAGETVDRCVNEHVSAVTFYSPACRELFSILTDLRAAKATINLEVLAEELKTRRKMEAVGGFPYLMQVTGRIPTTAHAGYFIEKVKEKAMLREVIRSCTGAVERAYSFTGGLDEFMAGLESDITSIGRERSMGIRSWQEAADDANRRLDEMLAANGEMTKGEVSWGFRDFDRAFEPMQPGQLVILAARPSVGKSSLMRQIVQAAGLRREPTECFIATLEVKDYNIAKHMAQSRSGIPYKSLKYRATPEAVIRFKTALSEIRGLPIHTLDDFSASSAKICAQARLLHSRRKLGLICVDHLQEVPDTRGGNGKNTTEAIGDVAKDLKALAGELDVPVLVLSQLNRTVEHENREPRLHDLRASGDIEQAADKVVFLHRPTHDHQHQPQSITAELKDTPNFYIEATQMKGRDDGTAKVGLMFRRETATFYPIQL